MIDHNEKQAIIAKSLLGPEPNFFINLIRSTVEKTFDECAKQPDEIIINRIFKNIKNTLKFFPKKKLLAMIGHNSINVNKISVILASESESRKVEKKLISDCCKTELINVLVSKKLAKTIINYFKSETIKRNLYEVRF